MPKMLIQASTISTIFFEVYLIPPLVCGMLLLFWEALSTVAACDPDWRSADLACPFCLVMPMTEAGICVLAVAIAIEISFHSRWFLVDFSSGMLMLILCSFTVSVKLQTVVLYYSHLYVQTS